MNLISAFTASHPFSEEQVLARHQKALELARLAGEQLIAARASGQFSTEFKDHHELVTSCDQQVDAFLTQSLQAAFPEDVILSEELAPDTQAAEAAEALWILDPIDGTVNFAHGQVHMAVSIGFYHRGQPLIGVVHAPFLQETYTAIRGQGAFLNGEPIAVSGLSHFRNALIATGFPYEKSQLSHLINRLAYLLPECQDIRRCGSAALDLCHVAQGRLDGYYESLSLWDFAAAILIAEEAGAKLAHLYPDPHRSFYLDTRDWVVSTPDIHQDLIELLLEADAP